MDGLQRQTPQQIKTSRRRAKEGQTSHQTLALTPDVELRFCVAAAVADAAEIVAREQVVEPEAEVEAVTPVVALPEPEASAAESVVAETQADSSALAEPETELSGEFLLVDLPRQQVLPSETRELL